MYFSANALLIIRLIQSHSIQVIRAEQAFQMLLANDTGSEEESDTEDIDEHEDYGNEAD